MLRIFRTADHAEVVLHVRTGLAHVTSRTKSLGSSVTASDCGDLRVLPADCSGTQALSTPKDSHGPMRSHIPAGQNKGETDMGGDLPEISSVMEMHAREQRSGQTPEQRAAC